MESNRDSNAIFYFTLAVIVICSSCIWCFSGVYHEAEKFKVILLAFICVSVIHAIVLTPLKFAILAFDAAWFPSTQAAVIPDQSAKAETLVDRLKFRLQMLRSELLITESHRNEKLNLKYHLITEELFRTIFLFLVTLILNVTRSEKQWVYFNTANMRSLFNYNHNSTLGLSNVTVLPNIYVFIEYSLIIPFTDTGDQSGGVPWVHAQGTRLLGVVRLRQVRTNKIKAGLNHPVFDNNDYSEGWTLPYVRELYTNKFWQIYQPWVARVPDIQNRIFLSASHRGGFISYPEITGYENLLCDTRAKSMMVLNYLRNQKWLDLNTSALFMDFTLYNADANLFSVCTLWVEQYPFGTIETHMNIKSLRLLDRTKDASAFVLLNLYLFVIAWLIFAKAFWIKVWYERQQLKNPWMVVDAIILILCVVAVLVREFRDNMVREMIRRVEISVMVEFINFTEPATVSYLCKILEGFALALITMRLWKAMQFTSPFQLFTNTLYKAWDSLLWTTVVILTFLFAIGIAAVIINGNNAIQFSTVVKGIISLVSFAFGFSSNVDPTDLFDGGKCIGMVLYALLAFVVKILLVNVMLSVLEYHMAEVKAQRDNEKTNPLTYFQFLRVEYAYIVNFVLKLFRWRTKYLPRDLTVAENIELELNMQKKSQRKHTPICGRKTDEGLMQLRYRERIEKTITVTAILQTQMELIERLMFGDDEGNLPHLDEDKKPRTSGQSEERENK